MKLECDPNRPGDLYLNGALFASIHPGQAGLSDEPLAQLRRLAAELARRWNLEAGEARRDASQSRRLALVGAGRDMAHSEIG